MPKTVKNPKVAKIAGIHNNVAKATPGVELAPVVASKLTHEVALPKARQLMGEGMQMLTAAIALPGLTPIQRCANHDYVAFLQDALEEAKTLARGFVLDIALKEGKHVGANGQSRALALPGGLVQRVTLSRSGLDPKKFEAALRAKKADVTKYMAQEIVYKLSETSRVKAIDDKLFTEDELKALEYPPSYRVDRTKEAKEGDE